MGKLLGGGSKSKSTSTQMSESGNKAYHDISNVFLPQTTAGNNAIKHISDFLGMGSGPAGSPFQPPNTAPSNMTGVGGADGFQSFLNSMGFNFVRDRGMREIENSFAGRRLLNSGATLKSMAGYGEDLAQTYADRYLDRLFGLVGTGQQAGQLVSNAGQYSTSRGTSSSTSKSSGGIGSTLGAMASTIAMSERKLKTNIQKLGELEDGLGIYSYEYKNEPGLMYIGTMVEEVENLRPWALGPVTEEGHRTVDYGKLSNEGEK